MKKTSAFIALFFLLAAGPVARAVNLEMPLPGMPGSVAGPAEYIRYLFTFGLSLVGFLAVVAIIIGGVQYMLSGSVGGVDKAKSTIIGAVSGVGLLLCSYLLLATIDPSLTNLVPRTLPPINIKSQTTSGDSTPAPVTYSCFYQTEKQSFERGNYKTEKDCEDDCPKPNWCIQSGSSALFQNKSGPSATPKPTSGADRSF